MFTHTNYNTRSCSQVDDVPAGGKEVSVDELMDLFFTEAGEDAEAPWVHSADPSNRSRKAGSGLVYRHTVLALLLARSSTSVRQSLADVLNCWKPGSFIEPDIRVVVGVKLCYYDTVPVEGIPIG